MPPPPSLFTIIKCTNLFNLQHPTLLPSRPVMFFFLAAAVTSQRGSGIRGGTPAYAGRKLKSDTKGSLKKSQQLILINTTYTACLCLNQSILSILCCWGCRVLWATSFGWNSARFSKYFAVWRSFTNQWQRCLEISGSVSVCVGRRVEPSCISVPFVTSQKTYPQLFFEAPLCKIIFTFFPTKMMQHIFSDLQINQSAFKMFIDSESFVSQGFCPDMITSRTDSEVWPSWTLIQGWSQ